MLGSPVQVRVAAPLSMVEMRPLLALFTLLTTAASPGLLAATERKLLPGDWVRLASESVPAFCFETQVAADGTIRFPSLGFVTAVLQTPSKLASRLEALIEAQTSHLLPGLTISPFSGPSGLVRVSGFVQNSVELRWHPGMTLAEVLGSAKPTEEGDVERIELSPAEGETIRVSSEAGGLRLKPGDRISVSRKNGSEAISVVGGVERASSLPFRRGFTLGMALQAAGGLSVHADPKQLVILRSGEQIPAQMPEDEALLLQKGDVIRVELVETRRFLAVQGLVAHPGLAPWRPGQTVTQAIVAAGGATTHPRPKYVILSRGPGQNVKVFVLDFEFLIAGRIPDPELFTTDTLELVLTPPSRRPR